MVVVVVVKMENLVVVIGRIFTAGVYTKIQMKGIGATTIHPPRAVVVAMPNVASASSTYRPVQTP